MKKILSFVLILTLMIPTLLLAGCGAKETYTINHNIESIKENIEINGSSKGYSITLRFTTDGESEDITFAKKGFVYYVKDRDGKESYYDLGVDELLSYSKAADATEWTAKSTKYNDNYTKIDARDDLDLVMDNYSNYLVYYAIKDIGTRTGFTSCSEEEINGRKCLKYSQKTDDSGVKIEHTYWIEQESGICIKYLLDTKLDGKTTSFSVECVDYTTPYEIVIPNVQ